MSNGDEITNQKEIAEKFADYFCNVGKKQAERIATSTTKTRYIQSPTDETELIQLIANLKPQNSTGHDNIFSKLLKQIVQSIVIPMVLLINRSLSEGEFPELLKLEKVIPIYKSKEKDCLQLQAHFSADQHF